MAADLVGAWRTEGWLARLILTLTGIAVGMLLVAFVWLAIAKLTP
jgi:hypothetical protein